MERALKRLNGWQKAFFSLGSRLTLVRDCLLHMPCYYLLVCSIPMVIANKLESYKEIFYGLG